MTLPETDKFPLKIGWLVLLLLSLIFAQAIRSAARTSITVDEGLHIASGYSILRTGDFRLVEEHPPLVKLLEALPLLPVPGLQDPTTLTTWESDIAVTDSVRLVRAAQELIYPYEPIDRLVFAARVPVALLAVLLGAVVFRWAKDLGSWKGGLLALCLVAFDPNILAHAAVSGTDLGAACFITLSLFGLTRFLRHPTPARLIVAGVTLGLAQGTKLSALLLLPIVIGLGLAALPRQKWPSILLLLLIAGLVLWGIYGLEVGSVPGLPFPVPAASHYIPWQRLQQHMADGHAAFLLGENSTQGWWYYFPVAFALKTPLPTLILLTVAALTSLRRHPLADYTYFARWRTYVRRWGALITFPTLYILTSLLSNLNIGYRHLLPVLPCLFVTIGALIQRAAPTHQTAHGIRYALYASLVWLALGTLRISPHYLAYFNELAGGPDEGYRFLADSNTDWGQAYKNLARFQQERAIGPVRLSAFIFYDPAIYGVEYEPLTPMRGDTPAVFPARFNPPPGEYVISATTLDGIPLADPEMYDWFRQREPDAKIGHVLFYYHVTKPHPPPTWVAQCTTPVPPLSPEAIAEGFGRDANELRLAYFDCTQSWLYPDGGESPGWYVTFRGSETETEFTQTHQEPLPLTYEQRISRGEPSFTIHAWHPKTTMAWRTKMASGPFVAAPSDWGPAQAFETGTRVSAPIEMSGPLAFLGYRLDEGDEGDGGNEDPITSGQTVELWTYWAVTQPPTRPISLMAHLLNEAGQATVVGDGLGVPMEEWRPGDVIVQRHALTLPTETAPGTYWMQSGAYTLPDLKRMAVMRDGQAIGDRLLLTQVEVAAP